MAQNEYGIINTHHISGAGGWDYIALHKGNIHVSRGTQVNILNQITGDSFGFIPHANGVHGIAFNDELGEAIQAMEDRIM